MLATSPPAIVRALNADEQSLQAAIAAWDGTGRAPKLIVSLAIDRERLLGQAAESKAAALRIIRLDPAETDDVDAARDLVRLGMSSPPQKGALELRPAPPATKLLAWYQQAQERFGVRWQLLAAINFVETAFGRVRNTSGAGAQGPMQFEPATWQSFGLGGDVNDPRDAIMGAANYLQASGCVTDARAALRHYNPSPLYVDAVLHYAHRMTHVPTAFLEYYAR